MRDQSVEHLNRKVARLTSELVKVKRELQSEIQNNIKMGEAFDREIEHHLNANERAYEWEEQARALWSVMPKFPEEAKCLIGAREKHERVVEKFGKFLRREVDLSKQNSVKH
jgi:hypothetical protein